MSVTVQNTTASLSGKTLAKLEDAQTFTGQKTFDIGASAPFVVVSGAAKVANLDADLLDGEEATDFHDAAQLTGLVPNASLTVIQTTTGTGGQDNFAPSAGPVVIIRCTGAAPNFTGFSGGTAGRCLILECLGTTLKVTNEATSTAANQIICESTSGQIVGAKGRILLVYDATSSRWRATVLDCGAWISVSPSVSGSGSMTWTTVTTDAFVYQQRGNHVTVAWYQSGGTVGGTPDVSLQFTIPGGFTSTRLAVNTHNYRDNSAFGIGRCFVTASGTLIALQILSQGNWTAGTAYSQGQITFEVN